MDELADEPDSKRINLTDAEAQFMKTRQGIMPAFNAQAVVSPVELEGNNKSMLVTAVEVVEETNDFARLIPMLEQAEETTDTKAETTLADAGYHSGSNLEECANRGQQVVMPESQHKALKQSVPQGSIQLTTRTPTAIPVLKDRDFASATMKDNSWRTDAFVSCPSGLVP